MQNRTLYSIALALSGLAAIIPNSPAAAKSQGIKFLCHFGNYGIVTINTREPGSYIIVKNKKYPTTSGGYFYLADDDNITISFNSKMTVWGYADARIDPDLHAVHDRHCTRITKTPIKAK